MSTVLVPWAGNAMDALWHEELDSQRALGQDTVLAVTGGKLRKGVRAVTSRFRCWVFRRGWARRSGRYDMGRAGAHQQGKVPEHEARLH